MAEKIKVGLGVYEGMTTEKIKDEIEKKKKIVRQMLDEGKHVKQIADETGYNCKSIYVIRQNYLKELGIPLKTRNIKLEEVGYLSNFRKEWIEACNKIRSIYGLELQKSYEERYEQKNI